ncbi:MAG: hypothetical protein H6823_24200 [Planctomycetaceae bacterium]|nr:hypothetical protein [Planctomycetales bacterium]MCB9941347.1 hypothetical protein [Planctomycetaceae bacterium]
MRYPLPQLTTLLLLIHMGFGCCFHHAHACDSSGCELKETHAGDCDGHDHPFASVVLHVTSSALTLSDCHEERHSHECSGEDCKFVAISPRWGAAIEEANEMSWLTVASLFPPTSTQQESSLAYEVAPARSGVALRRTHLALHILQV